MYIIPMQKDHIRKLKSHVRVIIILTHIALYPVHIYEFTALKSSVDYANTKTAWYAPKMSVFIT